MDHSNALPLSQGLCSILGIAVPSRPEHRPIWYLETIAPESLTDAFCNHTNLPTHWHRPLLFTKDDADRSALPESPTEASHTAPKVAMESVACDLCGETNCKPVYKVEDRLHCCPSLSQFTLVRCLQCGLIYVNPRPTVHSIAQLYPTQYYTLAAFHEDTASQQLLRVQQRRLSDITRFASVGTLLDIGCGAGQFLSAARDMGWATTGIEISAAAADTARHRYGLDIIQGDFLSISTTLPTEHFDVITMWGVLEHFHKPSDAIRKAALALKPHGLLVILVPNINSTQARLFGPKWYLLDIPRHLYHFSLTTLSHLASLAELTPVWIKYYAKEHDVSSLILSAETALGLPSNPHDHTPKRKPLTTRRIAMALVRRTAPALARVIAFQSHSAAMEIYFMKRASDRL